MDADEQYLVSPELQNKRTAVFMAFLSFFPLVECAYPDDESEAVVRAHLISEFEEAPPHMIVSRKRLVCVDLDVEYVSSVKFGTIMRAKRDYPRNSLLFPCAGILEITNDEERGHRKFVTPFGVTINATQRANYIRFVKISCQANCKIFHCFEEESKKIASFIMAIIPIRKGDIISITKKDKENEPNLNYSCVCGEPGCIYDPDRDNPLACHIDGCPKQNNPYKTSKGLQKHNRVHHSTKPIPRVKCRQNCGDDFVDAGSELRHFKIKHLTGEERQRHMFECIGCGNFFISRNDLGNHLTGARGCREMLNYMENERMNRPEQFRTAARAYISSSESDTNSSTSSPPPTSMETRGMVTRKNDESVSQGKARIVRVKTPAICHRGRQTASQIVDDGQLPGPSSQRPVTTTNKQVRKPAAAKGTATTTSNNVSGRTRAQLKPVSNEEVVQSSSDQESMKSGKKTSSKPKKKPQKKNDDASGKKKDGRRDRKDEDGAGGETEGTGRYNMRARK